MPLARYQIRNEYSLADPELYRAADKDDPEALLEGVAMAGLVGVLRQLGDLAQFAAQIFHDLHEEVMATAARGHGLMARVQQLEAEVPSLEKTFLSQTHHLSFFSNGGTDWHPNLRSEQNLITQEDLPRFVMNSYEECRGPPRLFLLDKFDVAGAGACLKRYTDPSFFKLESASSKTRNIEIHREKKIRKFKQKKAARLRNGDTPEVVPTHAKLHQLLLEERIENGYSNPARLVNLKKRQLNESSVEAKMGRSYMEKFLESPSPDYKMVCETSIIPLPMKSKSEDTGETGIKVLEISTVSPVKRSLGNESTCSSPNEQESELKPFSELEMETNGDLVKVCEQMPASVTDESSYNFMKAPEETELAVDGQQKLEASLDSYHSDDAASEVDNYMDALTTMESEMETDNEYRPMNSFSNTQKSTDSDGKEHQLQAQFSYSQSFGESSTSDEISSFKQDRNDERNELQSQLSDSQSIGTSSTLEENSSFKRETSEEHMELHPQFSDSQSVGNSLASEENSVIKKDRSCFSHSDSLGIMVDNIKSEPLLPPSTTSCKYEIEDASSNQHSQIVELQKSDCDKFVMHDDAEFQEEDISESGQPSSSSCLMSSGHKIAYSDSRANSPMVQPTGTQLVETTSDTVELHSSLADEDRKCLVEPTTVVPDTLSVVKNDACPVFASEKYHLNNLDDHDPYVQSGASLQISNDLDLAPVIVPTGAQLVETQSDPVEIHSSLVDNEERRCHVESVAAIPDDLSIMKDDSSVVSSEKHPLNNLDDGDLYVHSDVPLQITNDLELEPVVVPRESHLVETPSEPVELHSSIADDEGRKSCVESMAAAPDAFSVAQDDPVVSSEEYALNNLDNGDPCVRSDASLKIPNELNFAPVDEFNGHSETEELQAGCAEIVGSREVSSPGEHTICPFTEEGDLYLGTTLPLDGPEVPDLKAECCIIASKLKTEDSSPAVETPPASSLTRVKSSHFTHDSPKDEPASAGVEVLYSDWLSGVEEMSRMEHSDEKSGSTCSMDVVGDDGHLEKPSFPGYAGQEKVNVNDVYTEKVQSEYQAASAAPFDSTESSSCIVACPASDLISSSSRNPADSQNSFPGSSDSYQSEKESNEAESAEVPGDLNAEKRNSQLEPSSDIISSSIASSSMRDPTNLEESLSSCRDPHAKDMEVKKEVARESLTELEVQKVVDQPENASADVGFSLNRLVSQDLSDLETSVSIQDSSHRVQSQYISSANDVTMVREFSELATQESESIQNNSLSLPSYAQRGSETPAEQFLQTQADQQDASFLRRVEENSVLEQLQSEHMDVLKRLEEERSSRGASESALEMQLDQPLSSKSLSLPAGYEINGRQYAMDSLKPPLPDPFPVASEINLGEMPPMPPLPPMQWRRGKAQHASHPSQRELREVSLASFQPIQAIKTDENSQFGLLTSDRETLQYQNRLPPVMAVEGDKIHYSSGFSVGVPGHPIAVPWQFPFTVNEAHGQYNYLVLDRSQLQNPFFTFPVVSTDRPPHGQIVASEGEMVQNSNPSPPMPPADPLYSQERPTQSPNQLMAETSLEDKPSQHSSSNLEGEQEDPSITPTPTPSMETEQPIHSLLPSEGEMASSLDVSSQTSEFEGEKPNGIPKNKLPRPRNPLIDAVAAHDKSKLRKVTERVRPDTAPEIDERDSLLKQIRTKSFNLKPAAATRPSHQGPRTNLKVAAILEKANAIRQALAGSDDEDDDAESWSDS